MEPLKWVDRKFSFGYDKRHIPFFIERLKGTAPRLDELLRNVDDAHASLKINNAWSVKEHVGHLCDLESLHEGRIDDFVAALPALRAADMTNKETNEANHNAHAVPYLLAQFRERREKFIKKVILVDEACFDTQALHPRLQQTVTFADILFFLAEHDNHHLTKIAGLL